MRRLRLPVGRTVLFLCLLLAALVIFTPLSIALAAFGVDGLSARTATGSVWSGTLREARFGRFAIGDVAVGLEPLPLFAGRARVAIRGTTGRGALTVTRHSMGIDDVTARLLTGAVLAPVPLDSLDLDDLSVRFLTGRCDRAEGRVRATFGGDVGGLALAQGLSGVARCDGELLLLPLVSQSTMERLNLRIDATGKYRAEFFVRSDDPVMAAKLGAAGFAPAPGGFVLRLAGTL